MNLHLLQQLDPAAPRPDSQSRRNFMGALASGVGAALAAPHLAEGAESGGGGARPAGLGPTQSVKQNPAEQYFRGPFKKQSQPWPGLADASAAPAWLHPSAPLRPAEKGAVADTTASRRTRAASASRRRA